MGAFIYLKVKCHWAMMYEWSNLIEPFDLFFGI